MNPTATRLRTILSDEADGDIAADAISADTKLAADMGMGASQRIALTYRLECEFAIKLDPAGFDAITSRSATVGDVLAVVERLSTHFQPTP
jgi:acyl carrier protein